MVKKKKKASVLIRDFPEELESSPQGRESERTKGRLGGEETRDRQGDGEESKEAKKACCIPVATAAGAAITKK